MKLFLVIFLFVSILSTPIAVGAQDPVTDSFTYASQIGGGALGSDPLQVTIVSLINVALSFTAIIFTGMTVYGGALYVTSHVNEDDRDYAMSTLKSGVIGMAFIIFSMSISKFVLASVSTASGGGLTF